MITRGKYKILKFPILGMQKLHTVKVIGLYDNPMYGRIVQYRYNWPFPITEEVTEAVFEQWVATSIEENQPNE